MIAKYKLLDIHTRQTSEDRHTRVQVVGSDCHTQDRHPGKLKESRGPLYVTAGANSKSIAKGVD